MMLFTRRHPRWRSAALFTVSPRVYTAVNMKKRGTRSRTRFPRWCEALDRAGKFAPLFLQRALEPVVLGRLADLLPDYGPRDGVALDGILPRHFAFLDALGGGLEGDRVALRLGGVHRGAEAVDVAGRRAEGAILEDVVILVAFGLALLTQRARELLAV